MGIVLALLAFGLLIISHEFGHFLLAKLNGVCVEEFSVGMGPRLFSWKGKETRYSLKAIPFGGSCMMLGEDEDCQDERAFGSKSVWARISILAAGAGFNFILAFILAMVVLGCMGIDKPILTDVMEGYPAQEAGIQAGDRIVKLNDEKIHVYRDVNLYLALHQGETLNVVYERDGKMHESVIKPKWNEESNSYMMGIVVDAAREKQGLLGTMKYSFYEVGYWMRYTMISLKMMISGEVGVKDISGPVGMVSSMSSMVKQSSRSGIFYIFINLANFCILLSANLGVLNLLPLPALDGGRLFFCLIELVRGKPVKQEYEAIVHGIGLVLLLGLSVLILFKDIWQLFL
ncbi:MAG: RIP metalloprotease RseP [Lachnospiraceae bacterium]|nr:RIP metalloprotease RseP [Lachnospiraceae bacterium]